MENPTNPNSVYKKPNIIFITVDQMRFPMHFPLGTPDADRFVANYMPNLYKHLWTDGVKFSNFYTAASDCTAARATIHTGLYAYQTYSMLTLTEYPEPPQYRPPLDEPPYQPELDPDFPTIGHLMRKAGYETPYFGKWHLSYNASELERYGYVSHTKPGDLIGLAGQGLETDGAVAEHAAKWVTDYVASSNPNTKPLFMALNFVNPHDKQWFWGGMQANNFNSVYSNIPIPNSQPPSTEEPPRDYTEIEGEAEPWPRYSPDIKQAIPNWENQQDLSKKPQAQTIIKEVFQYQMGGIYEEDMEPTYTPVTDPAGFSYAPTPLHPSTPIPPGKHKAIAPPEYWSKALDSYIQVLRYVDDATGRFMENIPEEVRRDFVFVFTSDHGEYASSHGLQGKGGTVYEEGIRVPLIVRDLSNGFTANAEKQRNQLSSSVDLLPMIVSMGFGGTGWMTNDTDYGQLYGNRCDLLSILLSPDAPGRNYALHSTDEFIPDAFNYLDAPLHVIGLIAMDKGKKTKLGVYTNWAESSSAPNQAQVLYPTPTIQAPNVEFYDHNHLASELGQPIELESTPDSAEAQVALKTLFGDPTNEILSLLGSELQAPLPAKYQDAQRRAYHKLLTYMQFVNETALGSETKDQDESQQLLARAWAF